MNRCSNCDHPNDDGAVFCANCHHFLEWESDPGAGGVTPEPGVPAEPQPEPAAEPEPAPAPDSEPQRVVPAPRTPLLLRPPGNPVQKLVAAIDASADLAERRGRPDLEDRLNRVRTMVEGRPVTVAVVGEFKRGKSTLVNALLQTAACPVDADVVTGVPTLVSYGPEVSAVAHLQRPGELSERTEPLPFADVVALVSERSADRPSDLRTVEVRVPHRMLRSGLRLLDTPGVGGLESVHGQLSLASLAGADGVLFVTDASQELTAPELGYLRTAVERCPRAALVVTKTDLHHHWRLIAETNRRHLAEAGLDLPVLAVSSFLRLRAARDPALNEESGFVPLARFLAGVVEETRRQQAGDVAHQVDFVAAQLAQENDVERVVLAKPEERAEVVGHLDQVHERARSLSAPSAPWQQVLADGIQDLVADVEHDLAARLRTVLRDVRDIVDESDPKDTWEETQGWLRRQVAQAGVANRDLLVRRANALSDSVAEQFSFDAGTGVEVELDSVTRTLAALELPSASSFTMPGGRLASVLSSGRLAAYVPLMALSVALHTTVMILPPAFVLGAVVGRKLFQMEGKRQKLYRQGQAKAAATKFVDEVAFEMNKDTRDGLRRTQRRLRDEFQSRADTLRASSSAALAAARRASDLPPQEQRARAAQLDRETRGLGEIRREMRTLATAGAGHG